MITNTRTSVYRVKPEGFSATLEVAACHVESNGKMLLLKRAVNKSEGSRWGVPAGKFENGESGRDAVIRETFEETGIRLDESRLKFVGKFYVRKPGIEFAYHVYHQDCETFPSVCLNDEHTDYRWVTREEAVEMPLVTGGVEVFQHFNALINRAELLRRPFYFIRHGETDVNANANIKRVDYDLPLNCRGREQAELARGLISEIPFESVCFSPIQRAVETKDILVEGLQVEHVEVNDLSECKAHVWTKMVKLEEGHGYHVCEEVERFLNRVVSGLNKALERESSPLIVAHGGIHWALCYHMEIKCHPWKIGNCELIHFCPKGDFEWEVLIL